MRKKLDPGISGPVLWTARATGIIVFALLAYLGIQWVSDNIARADGAPPARFWVMVSVAVLATALLSWKALSMFGLLARQRDRDV